MQSERVASPFAREPLTEVPLDQTPLVIALCQVRLPKPLSKLQKALADGDLQESLSATFPYAEQQEAFQLLMQPGEAPVPQPAPSSWVLTSEDQNWVATLTGDSVSLTTTRYQSRADFCARANELLKVVESLVGPPRAARIGIRYVNRVPEADDLTNWIHTLAQGARGIMIAVEHDARPNLTHALSQVLYSWPGTGEKLQGRWGLLPPEVVLDAAIPSISQPSWVLDIDSFDDSEQVFDAQNLTQGLDELAAQAYRFFRWVLTPESLERFNPRRL